MPSAVRFDYPSEAERLAAIDALTQARATVWNAWFLAEADDEDGYGLACHWYAKLLKGKEPEAEEPT